MTELQIQPFLFRINLLNNLVIKLKIKIVFVARKVISVKAKSQDLQLKFNGEVGLDRRQEVNIFHHSLVLKKEILDQARFLEFHLIPQKVNNHQIQRIVELSEQLKAVLQIVPLQCHYVVVDIIYQVPLYFYIVSEVVMDKISILYDVLLNDHQNIKEELIVQQAHFLVYVLLH